MAKEEKSAAELYRQERKARIAKAAKKNNKKTYNPQAGKTAGKVLAVILVLAIISGVTAFAVSYTGLVEKNRTALTVGDVAVSQPEYAYYYTSGYNMVYQYAQYGMISYDTSATPSSQTYNNVMGEIPDFPEDQTPTWADFFKYYAENNLKYIKAFLKIAEEKNITLDDSDKKTIEENIESLASTAKSNNYSVNAYLRMVYGKGVNEKLLRTILEEQTLAQKVEEAKTEELKASYTDKQVEKEYKNHTEEFATINYRSYKIAAEKVKGDDDDSTESVTDETLAAAKKKANAFADAVTDEESFKSLAADNEKADKNKEYKLYITDDSKTLQEEVTYSTFSQSASDTDLTAWAFNSKTKAGETYVSEGTDGYTVYMMVSPMHKAADTVTYDVRHILIKFPTTESSDTSSETEVTEAEATAEVTEAETTTEAATEKAEEVEVTTLDTSKYSDVNIYLDVDADTATDKATYKKAQDILEEYLNGDRTEEAFEKLEEKYSEDTDDDGNLNSLVYEDTPTGQMVPQFESWSLAEGRKAGDVGIVETTYGYHIMYFIKTTTTTWQDTVKATLAQEDLSTYQTEVVEGDNVKISGENDKALTAVADFLDNLAKQSAKNQSSQSSY